jgi:hypothetical protein
MTTLPALEHGIDSSLFNGKARRQSFDYSNKTLPM